MYLMSESKLYLFRDPYLTIPTLFTNEFEPAQLLLVLFNPQKYVLQERKHIFIEKGL